MEQQLWSQPMITGRRIGIDLENGQVTLLAANVSTRSIVVQHEIYDRNGSKIHEGSDTVSPGRIAVATCLNGGNDSWEYMYCKLWFEGSRDEIRASLIMSTVTGDPGNERFTPVYGMSFS